MRIRKPRKTAPAPAPSTFLKMTMAEYLARPEMSSSQLKDFKRHGPGRWRDLQALGERDSTEAQLWGTCFHSYLLEGRQDWVVLPETYPKADGTHKPWNSNAKVCQEWEEQWVGYALLSKTEADTIRCAAMLAFNVWSPSPGALIEHVAVAELNGIPFRCRPDYCLIWPGTKDVDVVDVKTTGGLLQDWAWEIDKWGYHIQEEIYTRILRANGWKPRFRFLVVEKNPPHHAMLVALGPETKREAELWVNDALKEFKSCRDKNEWPPYRPEVIDMPKGRMRLLDEEMEQMAGDLL